MTAAVVRDAGLGMGAEAAVPALPAVRVDPRNSGIDALAPHAPTARAHHAMWLRLGLVAALATIVVIDLPQLRRISAAALVDAWRASSGWLVAASVLAVASMIAFGLMRQRTIRAAGGRLSLREAVAVSYAAGAIHMTTPGGVVASTAYAFRRLQRRGVPAGAVTWSLTVTGILSSVGLLLVGVGGFAIDDLASWTGLLTPALAALAAGAATAAVVRHPDAVEAVVARIVRRGNRLLRRAPDAGLHALHVTARDLRAVRPRSADWLFAGGAAVANWLLDLLCLWACALSLGIHLPPWMLLASYALAMAGAGVSPVPGGVGVVDGIVVFALTAGGHVSASVAVAAVLLYRVISLGSLLIGGWGSVAAQAVRWHPTAPPAAGPAPEHSARCSDSLA